MCNAGAAASIAALRGTPLLALAATIPSLAVGLPSGARAQEAMEDFVAVQAPTVALTNVKVIDGTGGPAREGQTIVIQDGRIADIGPADEKDTVLLPAASTTDILLELSNPGRWMIHCHIAEHLEAGMKMVMNVADAPP